MTVNEYYLISKYIKQDNKEEFLNFSKSVGLNKLEVVNVTQLAVALNSFAILESIFDNYIVDKRINTLPVFLKRPEDITTYEYSKYLITKQLLDENNIKYQEINIIK